MVHFWLALCGVSAALALTFNTDISSGMGALDALADLQNVNGILKRSAPTSVTMSMDYGSGAVDTRTFTGSCATQVVPTLWASDAAFSAAVARSCVATSANYSLRWADWLGGPVCRVTSLTDALITINNLSATDDVYVFVQRGLNATDVVRSMVIATSLEPAAEVTHTYQNYTDTGPCAHGHGKADVFEVSSTTVAVKCAFPVGNSVCYGAEVAYMSFVNADDTRAVALSGYGATFTATQQRYVTALINRSAHVPPLRLPSMKASYMYGGYAFANAQAWQLIPVQVAVPHTGHVTRSLLPPTAVIPHYFSASSSAATGDCALNGDAIVASSTGCSAGYAHVKISACSDCEAEWMNQSDTFACVSPGMERLLATCCSIRHVHSRQAVNLTQWAPCSTVTTLISESSAALGNWRVVSRYRSLTVPHDFEAQKGAALVGNQSWLIPGYPSSVWLSADALRTGRFRALTADGRMITLGSDPYAAETDWIYRNRKVITYVALGALLLTLIVSLTAVIRGASNLKWAVMALLWLTITLVQVPVHLVFALLAGPVLFSVGALTTHDGFAKIRWYGLTPSGAFRAKGSGGSSRFKSVGGFLRLYYHAIAADVMWDKSAMPDSFRKAAGKHYMTDLPLRADEGPVGDTEMSPALPPATTNSGPSSASSSSASAAGVGTAPSSSGGSSRWTRQLVPLLLCECFVVATAYPLTSSQLAGPSQALGCVPFPTGAVNLDSVTSTVELQTLAPAEAFCYSGSVTAQQASIGEVILSCDRLYGFAAIEDSYFTLDATNLTFAYGVSCPEVSTPDITGDPMVPVGVLDTTYVDTWGWIDPWSEMTDGRTVANTRLVGYAGADSILDFAFLDRAYDQLDEALNYGVIFKGLGAGGSLSRVALGFIGERNVPNPYRYVGVLPEEWAVQRSCTAFYKTSKTLRALNVVVDPNGELTMTFPGDTFVVSDGTDTRIYRSGAYAMPGESALSGQGGLLQFDGPAAIPAMNAFGFTDFPLARKSLSPEFWGVSSNVAATANIPATVQCASGIAAAGTGSVLGFSIATGQISLDEISGAFEVLLSSVLSPTQAVLNLSLAAPASWAPWVADRLADEATYDAQTAPYDHGYFAPLSVGLSAAPCSVDLGCANYQSGLSLCAGSTGDAFVTTTIAEFEEYEDHPNPAGIAYRKYYGNGSVAVMDAGYRRGTLALEDLFTASFEYLTTTCDEAVVSNAGMKVNTQQIVTRLQGDDCVGKDCTVRGRHYAGTTIGWPPTRHPGYILNVNEDVPTDTSSISMFDASRTSLIAVSVPGAVVAAATTCVVNGLVLRTHVASTLTEYVATWDYVSGSNYLTLDVGGRRIAVQCDLGYYSFAAPTSSNISTGPGAASLSPIVTRAMPASVYGPHWAAPIRFALETGADNFAIIQTSSGDVWDFSMDGFTEFAKCFSSLFGVPALAANDLSSHVKWFWTIFTIALSCAAVVLIVVITAKLISLLRSRKSVQYVKIDDKS